MMLDKKVKKKIEKILNEFFKKSTFEVDFEFGEFKDNNLSINLKTPEPQILIGPHGKILHSLQVVLGRIVRKQVCSDDTWIYLDIDINQYKQNKIRYLEETAYAAASRVALNRTPETLEPMSAFERRIIHMALAERPDVTTESAGPDEERRIVVKPA